MKVPLPSRHIEVRDAWIEVQRGRKRQVIAAIEVLSPTNKTGAGHAKYLAKRRKRIDQKIHLVELDLLLRGTRLPMGSPLPAGDYYALVVRCGRTAGIERLRLDASDDPLPAVPIPLAPPDADVILNLARVFATAYRAGPYADLVDYSVPPTTVKKPADRTWAATYRPGRAEIGHTPLDMPARRLLR